MIVFADGQVLMSRRARIERTGLAALLTLAFAFIWPPVHHGFASPHNHPVDAEAHAHLAHPEKSDQRSLLNVETDADCEAAVLGCCIMAHCCPGISVGPHYTPALFSNDGTTAASAVLGEGIDPGLVLPPPRASPV